jgi:hypothetical protein
MATITVPAKPHGKRPFFIAVGGILVALAIAAGLGAWQYTDHRGDSRPIAVASLPPVSDETFAPAVPMGGLAEQMQVPAAASSAHVIAGPRPRPVLYIVATDEAAEQVRARFAMFVPDTLQYQVLVLAPADDDGQLLSLLYAPSDATGVPPVEIIDPRGN